ncbi:MAG: esterase-like activity of phytase family protein, partial [Limisphaerales bacterium]
TNAADLILLTNCFTEKQLAPFAREKIGRYDCEGIAEDNQGRIYLCEEANRWILRCDPKKKKVERLKIDWSPVQKYFLPNNHNASFEGIAVGGGKLFVANERQKGRIIVVNLKTLKVVDDFTVRPSHTRAQDIHYSDLCWFENSLFALLRENRVVVKIDPKTHRVLAEYNFREMEKEPEVAYHVFYPTSTLEGLAVSENFIWLCTDNNGFSRKKSSDDTRPTLFKCTRPDR